MDCRHCSSRLVALEESFFYAKGEKNVHLSIKPEFVATVVGKKTIYDVRENKKKVRVKCCLCDSNVGCKLPFGPGGTTFYAFGLDKVKLDGRIMKKSQRWWETYKEFRQIETRDDNNFFNVLTININTEDVRKEKVPFKSIVFPSVSNLSDFEWYSVSLVKKPKVYQIEGFIEVLQHNLIVVIKTGAGKTLIASMFLGRMCSLNPNRMGLMIVDRIPLVFQQGDAIQSDTNLRVARICGENKTMYKMKQLNNGAYDILVVTAGAFVEMVEKKYVDTDLFCAVVFDECHHVVGGHRYVDCLKLFTKMALLQQPRILGLSASILSAKSVAQAEIKLTKFLTNIPNAKIFHRSLDKTDQSIERKIVTLTPLQKMFVKEVVDKVNENIRWICQQARVPITQMQLQYDLLNSAQLKGDLRALEDEHLSIPNFERNIKICHIAMESLEMCTNLGVPTAWKLLEDNQVFSEIECKYKCIDSLSNRLQVLRDILGNANVDSKVLVFVSTRNVARELFNYLNEEFPNFNMRKVFGHGGFDGMIWEGDQESVLKEFRTGSCNLLICTSVLEEGLDVTDCDLVICFSGIKNLIQYIQIRGRARKEKSRFIILQTYEENERNNSIQAEEKMLSMVLKLNQQKDSYFSNLTKDIMKKVEEVMSMDEGSTSSDLPLSLVNVDERSKIFTFNVYVDVIDGIDVNIWKSKLIHILEEYDDFQINRLEVITNDDTEFLSSKFVTTFLVGAVCRLDVSTCSVYRNFCKSFNYQIKLDNLTSNIWTCQNNTSGKLNLITTVKSKNYGVGFLRNKTSAVISKLFEKQEVTVQFTPRKYIEIIDAKFIRVIPLASLGKFALISTDLHTATLIVVLMYPPMMYIKGERDGQFMYDKKEESEKKERVSIESFGDGAEVAEELKWFASKPVLFITFDINKLNELKEITSSQLLFPVYTFDVNMTFTVDTASVERCVNLNNVCGIEDVLYTIKCVEDSRKVCFPYGFVEVVVNHINQSTLNVENYAKKAETIDLVQLVVDKVYDVAIRNHYFLDIYDTFNKVYQEYSTFPVSMRNVLRMPIPKHNFLVKRVIVTPSRLVVLPSVLVASNRLMRKLKEKEEYSKYDIIILSFKDEDMTKLTELNLYSRVHSVLTRGVEVNGVKYRFLLASGSQLREHKAYFISAVSYDEVLNIRSIIIPISNKFKSSAQYLSRLGQYGTADKFVETISKDSICWIEDIKAVNGDLTTDGAGKISMLLAAKIAYQQGIEIPSAFQVRYSGVKGILVSCPDNDPDFHGKQICLRKSMEKFSNQDEDLCLVGISKIFELTLNREVISLLSAIKSDWFLSNTLLNYQENALAKFANIFADGGAARDALKNHLPKDFIEKLKSHNFDIIEEKYWFTILQGIYRLQVLLLKTKTNIPVDKGCILIGVPDPLCILKEDEVFVQLKRDEHDTEVLCDPALIYRNPCLHPGDHRRVNCVYKEELSYLYNVLVMPVKNCTYSLASACSGGDLDGDKFGIIWDPKLVPSEDFIFNPCDYSSLTVKTLSVSPYENESLEMIVEKMYAGMNNTMYDGETNDHNLAKFYITFMANDCLGQIAHKHLALCDILDDGARDPLAIEMAKSQAQAVDYPKTGILPSVPKKALLCVQKNGYPDFMEKQVAETYLSKKILGQLYRRCLSVSYNFEFSSKLDIKMLINTSLIVKGNEEFLEEAVNTYRSYAYNMQMVMVKFDLKVEADIILGCATFGWGIHYQDVKGKTADAIFASYNAILDKYREIFFSDVFDNESQMKKASAWYRVANDPSIKVKYIHIQNEMFISFPWVVYDILCHIMSIKNREQPSRINFCIGESALKVFKKNFSILDKHIAEKTKVMKDVETSINLFTKENFHLKEGFVVNLYGSTSIYVCEPESDVDISVYAKPNAYQSSIIPLSQRESFRDLPCVEKQKHFLMMVVSPAVDRIVSSKTEHFDRTYPIVKCVLGDSENPISCDISMNEVGNRKTCYIHHLYQIDVCYLPLFWILVRWARIVGLVKSVDECSSVMDTADFYALVINLLDCPYYDNKKTEKLNRFTGIKYLYRCLAKLRFQEKHNLGKMIYIFLQKASNLEGNLTIKWPSPEIPLTKLDEAVLKKVSAIAINSYHCLLATRNISNLHSYCLSNSKQIKQLQKMLPLSISYSIGKAHAFHAARLTHMTGAIVTIESCRGKANLLLSAEGTQMAIDNLRSEIRLLLATNKALILGRLPNEISRYFMEGSSIVIVKGSSSIKSRCTFAPSFGSFELIHHAHKREMLLLKANDMENTWQEKEFERFLAHISKQMEMVSKENEALKRRIEVTSRFGCFYLVNLEAHLPIAQNSITIQELQYSMEKGRRSRKAWRRKEFVITKSPSAKRKLNEGSSYEMVDLKSPGRLRFSTEVKMKLKRQKNSKRGVASAFTPGLLKLNTRDDSARESLLNVYHQVLTMCGFRAGATHDRHPFTWKIGCSPSKAFEVQVTLDSDMSVVKVEERPLSWVHCTVISGKEQCFNNLIQCTPDIRMQIATADEVKKDSPLYKEVLLEINGKTIVPIELKDGKPILSPIFAKRAIQPVNTVRHVQTLEMHTNGAVDASIAYGDLYFGEGLVLSRPFCELSLYFDAEKLANSINKYLDEELMREFAHEYFKISLSFQEALEQLITVK